MALIFIAIAVVAAILLRGEALFVPAVVNAVLSFWANGVMSNFIGDADNAPSWATVLSFLTTIAGVVFLVIALV